MCQEKPFLWNMRENSYCIFHEFLYTWKMQKNIYCFFSRQCGPKLAKISGLFCIFYTWLMSWALTINMWHNVSSHWHHDQGTPTEPWSICSRCVKCTGSVFLTTFGICFTFLLYIVTGALVLFRWFQTHLINWTLLSSPLHHHRPPNHAADAVVLHA